MKVMSDRSQPQGMQILIQYTVQRHFINALEYFENNTLIALNVFDLSL